MRKKLPSSCVLNLKSEVFPTVSATRNAPGTLPELAQQAAVQEDCTAVLSVGGDGTAYEVACGLMNTGKPLGMIPAGTGNDFIKTTKTPKDPLRLLRLFWSIRRGQLTLAV